MTRLGDVCEKIGSGATPRGGKEAYKDAGIPIIRSQNIHDWVFQPDGLAFLDDEQAESLSNVEVRSNDVLLNITGDSVARACIVPSERIPARVNQHVAIVRAGKEINPTYLLASLQSKKTTLLSLASSGATRNALTKRMIENLDIDLPSREMQDSIAQVLDSIQYKITLNNRLNDYLSQICDAEFTDFVSNQRDASWHDGTLNELVEIRYGKDHKKLAEGPYPVYGSGGFMRSVEKPLSSGESVLIPRKGSLNNVMYVDEKFWTVDTMFFTIPLKPGAAKYVYQYTKRLDFGTMNSGSAVPSMTTKILNSLVIPIPSDSALVSFNKKLQPFFDLFGKNEEENRRLVSLRDILLHKLMSGEIDVSKVDLTQLTNNHLADC